MSFLGRLFGREQRDAGVRLSDPYLAEFLGQRIGTAVDVQRASGLSVAHACIACIAQNLAAMPLHLHRRTASDGRERAFDHPLYGVLHDMAADGRTAFEAREFLVASLLLRGNGFARVDWNGRGQVTELRPLDPAAVTVERLESGRLRYRVADHRGRTVTYTQDEILHLRYRLGPDGATGLSPVQIARETFALALTQQDQAGKQAGRSFRPEGVLSFAGNLGIDARDRLTGR